MKKFLFNTAFIFIIFIFSGCSKNPAKIEDDCLLIHGGTFEMGSDEIRVPWQDYQHPAHQLNVKDFYICETEVTQQLFMEIMGYNNSYYQGDEKGRIVSEGEDQFLRPVEKISWFEAIVFCNKLSEKMNLPQCYAMMIDGVEEYDVSKWGEIPLITTQSLEVLENWNHIIWNTKSIGYRLPTEAEWELASRGGCETEFTGPGFNYDADNAPDYYWGEINAERKTHQVKTKLPNQAGLYDMAGNVNEWCWDWFDEEFYTTDEAVIDNTQGPEYKDIPEIYNTKVVRGGGWDDEKEALSYVSRSSSLPLLPSRKIGFRVARNAKK